MLNQSKLCNGIEKLMYEIQTTSEEPNPHWTWADRFCCVVSLDQGPDISSMLLPGIHGYISLSTNLGQSSYSIQAWEHM